MGNESGNFSIDLTKMDIHALVKGLITCDIDVP